MTAIHAKENLLKVENLAAYKGERFLFQGLNFQLSAAQLLHVTGRNGVGKTTLLRILIGLGFIEEGKVLWNQLQIKQHRDFHQSIHYLGHKLGIKPGLSCYENLYFQAKLETQDINRELIESVLSRVGLIEKVDITAGLLSAGQKQRLAIARLLLLPRALWILDEPFTALDTDAQSILNQILEQHLDENGMVIITTHQDSLKITRPFNTLELQAAS